MPNDDKIFVIRNIDNMAILDDDQFETTSIDGDVTIHDGMIARIHIPPGTTNNAFVVEYVN